MKALYVCVCGRGVFFSKNDHCHSRENSNCSSALTLPCWGVGVVSSNCLMTSIYSKGTSCLLLEVAWSPPALPGRAGRIWNSVHRTGTPAIGVSQRLQGQSVCREAREMAFSSKGWLFSQKDVCCVAWFSLCCDRMPEKKFRGKSPFGSQIEKVQPEVYNSPVVGSDSGGGVSLTGQPEAGSRSNVRELLTPL